MPSNSEGADTGNMTTLGNTAYSFYLNVVVLSHVQPSPSASSSWSAETSSNITAVAEESSLEEKKTDADAADPADAAPTTPTANTSTSLTTKDSDASNTLSSTTKRAAAAAAALSPFMDKSLHMTMKAMSATSLAVTKKSTTVGNKATAFLASKTMITRASMALNKSLPAVIKSMGGLDLTIGSRFSQGNLTVLQVDLKATGLPRYVEIVRGKEAAEQFRTAQSALKAIGATDTMGSLEREMLPQVRKGLMDVLSNRLITTMKETESGLEVECIALEEREESRWLFNFMEFQSQMK